MMTLFVRRTLASLALLLAITPIALAAQETTAPLTIVGSNAPIALVENAAAASDTAIAVETRGTNAGINQFCTGMAGLLLSSRPLSAEEETACDTNAVIFSEYVIGHSIAVVVVPSSVTVTECLTRPELNAIFAPSATASSWDVVSPVYAAEAFTLHLPSDISSDYAIIDSLTDGVGLRSDVETYTDGQALIAGLIASGDGIGITSLPDALRAAEALTILDLQDENRDCATPGAESVEDRLYPAATTYYAYVNAGQVDAARPLVQALLTPDAAENTALTPASADAYSTALEALSNNTTGRLFSREITGYRIADSVSGQINIGGSAEAVTYFETISGSFITSYPGVRIVYDPLGSVDGIRRFCAGQLDAVTLSAALTDEQIAACEASSVTPRTFTIGARPVVLIANAADTYLECLTTEDVSTIWGVTSTDTVTLWQQVRGDFPEQTITLLSSPAVGVDSDILLRASGSAGIPERADVETNADPLFRAAAVANVEGALTYMTWAEYQRAVANGQERIQVVAIDAGDGCQTPSLETIASGDYPLQAPVLIAVSDAALARADVQAFLWTIYQDTSYAFVTDAGLVGRGVPALADIRASLEADFEDAIERAAQALLESLQSGEGAEATPEVTDEPLLGE